MVGANLTVVLAKDDLAHPVQTSLDAPVSAHPAGQQLRGGLAGVEAGDAVEGLHAPASPPGAPAADDRECLGRTGERKTSPCPSLLPVRSMTRMVRVSTRP